MEFTSMYRGASRIYHLTFDGNIAGGHVHFIVKARENDLDEEALLQKLWTLDDPIADGEFAGQTRGASIELLPEETSKFNIGTVYVGVEYDSALGRNYVLHYGPWEILRDPRETVG